MKHHLGREPIGAPEEDIKSNMGVRSGSDPKIRRVRMLRSIWGGWKARCRRVLGRSGGRDLTIQNVGFHGDEYLLALVDALVDEVDFFVETGTNVGSTLRYVASRWPEVECLSCESDNEAFETALRATRLLGNANVYNEDSVTFLERIGRERADLFDRKGLFWLDAHGYGFEWYLREEVNFVTRNFPHAFVLIDDFLVPEAPWFGFDEYDDQVCSFEYIRDAIHEEEEYCVWYPAYRERTSRHHPLCGWGLLVRHGTRLVVPDWLRPHLTPPSE